MVTRLRVLDPGVTAHVVAGVVPGEPGGVQVHDRAVVGIAIRTRVYLGDHCCFCFRKTIAKTITPNCTIP